LLSSVTKENKHDDVDAGELVGKEFGLQFVSSEKELTDGMTTPGSIYLSLQGVKEGIQQSNRQD